MKQAYLALFSVILGGVAAIAQSPADPIDQIVGGTRAGSLGCGARAIYLLLSSIGTSPTIKEIEAVIDPDGDGISNAADIIEYLRARSLNARLVQCEYMDLLSEKDRFILVLGNPKDASIKHFALAKYSAKEKALAMFDPTYSAAPIPLTMEELSAKMWQGVCIYIAGK